MTTLKLNHFYSFLLYPVSILGSSYSNVKLISILDYNTALMFENVELLHRQIFPFLPEGTPSNNTEYTYYLFEKEEVNTSSQLTPVKKKIVLAHPWIIDTSIQEITATFKTLRLNNISSSEFTVVRDQLRLLGISFDILSDIQVP